MPAQSDPPAATLTNRRLVGFDGIRGLATAMVVFYHLTVDFFPQPGLFPLPPDWTLVGAYVAVDLFFALSGFLLTRLVLESIGQADAGLDVRTYYTRRAIRILPGLCFFALGHFVYALLADLSMRNEAISLGMAFTTTLNIPNLVDGFVPNDGIAHLWTLAIELQFYLVLPIIVVLLPPRRPKVALAVLVGGIAAVMTWRIHLASEGTLGAYLLVRTDTHGDSVLAGIALAYAWPSIRTWPRPVISVLGWMGLAGWLYMALELSLSDEFTHQAGFTLAAVLSVLMIAAIARDTGPAAFFTWPPLVYLGEVSFGFYLWHVVVFRAFVRWGGHLPTPMQIGGALLVTAFFTAVSWYVVEKPAMAYFARQRRPAPLRSAPAA